MSKYQALIDALEAGPVGYACHCDLEPHMQPDGCVLDQGKPENCVYAGRLVQRGLSKTDCHEWKPTNVIRPTIEVKSATIRAILADLEREEKDAERWRTACHLVAGESGMGAQRFVFNMLKPSSGNIMRGSVSQHFTAAIDAALAQMAKGE